MGFHEFAFCFSHAFGLYLLCFIMNNFLLHFKRRTKNVKMHLEFYQSLTGMWKTKFLSRKYSKIVYEISIGFNVCILAEKPLCQRTSSFLIVSKFLCKVWRWLWFQGTNTHSHMIAFYYFFALDYEDSIQGLLLCVWTFIMPLAVEIYSRLNLE